MTDDTEQQPQSDPREEPFVVDTNLLTEDQLEGLVEEYCTRYHGINDVESPFNEKQQVMTAIKKGELVVWFNPVENTAGLGPRQ
ncbi:YheU family protein [Marinobacter sp. JSM 1782161]|uniref:YheU family protein n=1 Tax=Marinobacter sp. JSM 1782161 TaxID=2685906 RepID=UPI0014041442|nr:YheU family protein [Marinobacter sp. JSM 1782161]